MDAASEEAFGRFFAVEYPRLAGALRLTTGSETVAEELAQEAMYRAYLAWDRVRVMERPGAWVLTVGMNLARHPRHLPNLILETDIFADPSAAGGERTDLLRALGSLPGDQRAAVIVRHVLGYPTAEAAGILGRSPDAVRALLARAVRALRARLEEQCL